MNVPPLLHALFDDAALFPPGNASMPDAVAGQRVLGAAWYAGLVGMFICPHPRLAELDAELRRAELPRLGVSMTVPAGVGALAEALPLARSLPSIDLQAVELPVPVATLEQAVEQLRPLAAAGLAVFAELPAAEVTPAVATRLADAGIALKLRTGGTSQAAFPSREALAAALSAAAAADLALKCTAGLHHAVAHTDPATGLAHHGFLNVLLAVRAAQSGADPVQPLAAGDPRTLADRATALSPAEVDQLRRQLRSIGTCSVAEPLADLQSLGLVAAR